MVAIAKKRYPGLWDRLKRQIMAQATHGTKAGQWSARKAQLLTKKYKEEVARRYGGSGFRSKKSGKNSLSKWSRQKWRTKSGRPSSETGERYLPEKTIKSLSKQEYAASTRAKRKGTKQGKQFVPHPKATKQKINRSIKKD